MRYLEFEIDGFTFPMLCGSDDGIICRPGQAQPDNPQWISALKKAIAAFHAVEAFYQIWDFVEYEAREGIYSYNMASTRQTCRQCWPACQNHLDIFPENEVSEVKAFLERLKNGTVKQPPPYRKRQPEPRTGYVYVLKSDTGHYKIGRSLNPEDRLKTFTVKLPFVVDYEVLIKSDDYVSLEQELHAQFSDKHVNGEWFALTPEDIEYIKGLSE